MTDHIDEQIAAVRDAINPRAAPITADLRAALATLEQHKLALDALGEIRNMAFYHMVRNADQRGDRKVLGQIKELAIATLAAFDAGEKPR